MAKTSPNSPLHSLRGKICFAAVIFALVIAVYRVITYLIISLVAEHPLYTIFLPFVFVVAAIIVFGWWLSEEIIRPIEKVTLLAKSFERGLPTTPPKSSGAAETDELLQTLYRISQQTHKLVGAMDEVANGKLNAAPPDTGSDRLTQTFQKLLLKVSESIHAKQELEKLQAALAHFSEELAPVRRGNLDAKIKSEAPETREIAETLNYLLEQMGETVAWLKSDGEQMRNAALAAQETIRAVIDKNENHAAEMTQAAIVLRQAPAIIHQISEELSQSAKAANQSIEKARRGGAAAQENLKAAGVLRRQAQEAAKRIERLRERSQEISRIGKTLDDLAHRASMLALNASVQANGSGGEATTAGSFVVVSEEIDRLAQRASQTNKNISSLNQTLQSEIGEAENALGAAINEAANLSKLAIETDGALGELEKYVSGVLNLQDKIAAASRERGGETERAFQVFADAIDDAENSLASLKESISNTRQIAAAVEDLQSLASKFKVSKAPPETAFKIPAYPAVPGKDRTPPDLQNYTAAAPLSPIPPSEEEDFSYNFLGE